MAPAVAPMGPPWALRIQASPGAGQGMNLLVPFPKETLEVVAGFCLGDKLLILGVVNHPKPLSVLTPFLTRH